MDVTQEIRNNHIVYGASDYNNPNRYAAGKALNYAKGPSISRPDNVDVSVLPYTLHYEDQVGLFGAENYFVKVNVALDTSIALACYSEPGWLCAAADLVDRNPEDVGYEPFKVDRDYDISIDDDGYVMADLVSDNLPTLSELGVLSVDLNNLKTGNQYNDVWLDVRLYDANRKEWPYDKAYVGARSCFYIGFHARNTRRLTYNVECVLGLEYLPVTSVPDPRYLMRP